MPTHLILSPRRRREPDYELADILDALRVAWAAVQRRTPGATGMAWKTYDAVRRDDDPSAALLVARFGWQNICDHAGVPAGPALRPKDTYIRRWSTNDLLFWVALYLEDSQSSGTRPTYNGYDIWQRAHADAPSGATLRNRMREIGVAAWNEILAAARASLELIRRDRLHRSSSTGGSGCVWHHGHLRIDQRHQSQVESPARPIGC